MQPLKSRCHPCGDAEQTSGASGSTGAKMEGPGLASPLPSPVPDDCVLLTCPGLCSASSSAWDAPQPLWQRPHAVRPREAFSCRKPR